jgi:hypothetical protein
MERRILMVRAARSGSSVCSHSRWIFSWQAQQHIAGFRRGPPRRAQDPLDLTVVDGGIMGPP